MRIAVWGNTGSGKSTLAVKLASALADHEKDVVLIDADYNAPQTNVWFPALDMKLENSLSRLLDNNVDAEATAGKILVINKHLGVIGYAKDFASTSMPRRSDTSEKLLSCLDSMTDITVIDCQSCPINDILTFEAVMSADIIIVSITPDIKALSWYDSNVRMMEESWVNNGRKIIRVFNKAGDTAPVGDIEAVVGTVSYCLPYSIDIAEELYMGIVGENKKTAKRYCRVVETMAEDLLTLATK